MSLILMSNVFAFSGDTLIHGAVTTVRVLRAGTEVAHFNVDVPVEWLKVSPDGRSALIYGARGTRVWRWREGLAIELFAMATRMRETFGCGFLQVNGEVITVLARDGVLRGLSDDGSERFAANSRSPHSFRAGGFIQLPGDRVALSGCFFGDYCDTVITVALEALIHDSEAIQKAIRTKAPVRDRAIDITVGPCAPDAAVVLRDPGRATGEEEDIEDVGDVANFAGVYVRNLTTGSLIGRHPYSGRAGSGAPIAATPDWIALQVIGGVDMINRKSGNVHEVREAILDVVGLQLARLRDSDITQILSFADAVQNNS